MPHLAQPSPAAAAVAISFQIAGILTKRDVATSNTLRWNESQTSILGGLSRYVVYFYVTAFYCHCHFTILHFNITAI